MSLDQALLRVVPWSWSPVQVVQEANALIPPFFVSDTMQCSSSRIHTAPANTQPNLQWLSFTYRTDFELGRLYAPAHHGANIHRPPTPYRSPCSPHTRSVPQIIMEQTCADYVRPTDYLEQTYTTTNVPQLTSGQTCSIQSCPKNHYGVAPITCAVPIKRGTRFQKS